MFNPDVLDVEGIAPASRDERTTLERDWADGLEAWAASDTQWPDATCARVARKTRRRLRLGGTWTAAIATWTRAWTRRAPRRRPPTT